MVTKLVRKIEIAVAGQLAETCLWGRRAGGMAVEGGAVGLVTVDAAEEGNRKGGDQRSCFGGGRGWWRGSCERQRRRRDGEQGLVGPWLR